MVNKSTLRILTVSYLLLFTLGCAMKPGSSGRSSKYFETFYAGQQGGTQYFIKPIRFDGPDGQRAFVDMTLRDIDFKADSTTVNYTLTTARQLPANQAIRAYSPTDELLFETSGVKRFFQERAKDGFTARFSGKVPNTAISKAFRAGNFLISANAPGGEDISFTPNKQASSVMAEVYHNLFSLY